MSVKERRKYIKECPICQTLTEAGADMAKHSPAAIISELYRIYPLIQLSMIRLEKYAFSAPA
jgi:hypothetical protein